MKAVIDVLHNRWSNDVDATANRNNECVNTMYPRKMN